MTVETASYISQLDITLPTASDPKSEGDNHFRLIKGVLKTQFPNFGTNAVTPTAVEVNYLGGVTSGIQAQLNSKGAIAGQTWTGAHDFTGGSVNVPTATAGDNSTKAASTAFATSLAFAAALPSQTGNSGKFITTDGSTASWSSTLNGSLTFGGTGRRIVGDLENFTRANRLLVTNSGTATNAALGITPSANGGIGGSFEAFARVDPDNSAVTSLFCNQFAGKAGIDSGKNGTGSTLPLVFSLNGTEAARIDTSNNVLVTGGGVFGYGTGSGGTVTQNTSKSTTVGLNKPTGRIVMNNAALAAGASVTFQCNNTFVNGGFVGVAAFADGVIDPMPYRVELAYTGTGAFGVKVTNTSAGSLSQALQIDFVVYKGATS